MSDSFSESMYLSRGSTVCSEADTELSDRYGSYSGAEEYGSGSSVFLEKWTAPGGSMTAMFAKTGEALFALTMAAAAWSSFLSSRSDVVALLACWRRPW